MPLVSVAATDGVGTETVDGTDFTFTFSRTGSTSSALTVNYSIFPAPVDGATPGADFPAQTGTITFAAGSATAVLQFNAIDDTSREHRVLLGRGRRRRRLPGRHSERDRERLDRGRDHRRDERQPKR